MYGIHIIYLTIFGPNNYKTNPKSISIHPINSIGPGIKYIMIRLQYYEDWYTAATDKYVYSIKNQD